MKAQIFNYKSRHPIIHEIRLIQSDSDTDILTHFVPPLGTPEIVFYVNNEYQIKNTTCKKGFVKGQYTAAQKIDFIPNYYFLSVSLYPYGLKQLFNVHAEDFTNSVVDIENHPLTASLLPLFRNAIVIDALFVAQLAQAIGKFPLYPVSSITKDYINAIEKQDFPYSIQEIAKERGLGLRTLQRNFKNEVGLTPKEYLRIIRMNRIERLMKEKSNVFELISDFNFTDQSHFIREVKRWRNYAPRELVKKKLLLSDRLPIPDFTQL